MMKSFGRVWRQKGWNLVDYNMSIKLCRIENQRHLIEDYIRTGIATLRDGFYLVEQDDGEFYHMTEEMRYLSLRV